MANMPKLNDEGKISIDDVIALLNELLELDRPAMAALLANRVPCNEDLAHHPTVQVESQHGGYHVGMFGILNGLFKTLRNGYGQMMYVLMMDFWCALIKCRPIPNWRLKEVLGANESARVSDQKVDGGGG